tara:strand:+ start:405 stop:620 length:216 start_codon:yes stop_codon:yes gene_type:complete
MDLVEPEVCVEIANLGNQCVSGAALGAAILVELCCYFWVFIGGYKFIRLLMRKEDKVKIDKSTTSTQWNKK